MVNDDWLMIVQSYLWWSSWWSVVVGVWSTMIICGCWLLMVGDGQSNLFNDDG